MSRNVLTAAPTVQLVSVPQVVQTFGPFTNVSGTLEGYPLWTPSHNALVRISLYIGLAAGDVAPQGMTIKATANDPFGNPGSVSATALAPTTQGGAVGVIYAYAGQPILLYVEPAQGAVEASKYSYGAVIEEIGPQ